MEANAGSDASNELDGLILTDYPYPIAVNYKRLLDEQDWEKKTRVCIQVFELGLRAITLGLISQYLIRDAEKVSDPQLNQLLLKRLSRASLGTWNEMFFKALKAYQGKRNLFFMPELYDLYWDTSTSPHRPHKGIRAPFDQLVQIRNELEHGAPPTDEAGWQALFEEAFHLLRQALGHFTFLENYDLIRIRWAEAGKYWYDIYTGLQVISPSQPFRTKEDLTEGWFYLSKQEKKFLELHPLLIFWEKELVQVERERMRDAAIFDCFKRTSLDYLTTVLGGKVNLTDRTLIAEFIHTVYYTIEKVKMARREAKKLTWGLLKEVAEKISSERIGDVRSKYRREVYLQREETKRTFEEFLALDKTCLVLIGKSGVGKSNFFLSLMDEYEDSSEVCTLMYNGARFSVETDVADALTRDFELYLKLEGLAEREGVEDILFEINRIEEIAARKVVLLIDALNENPNAKGLLRRVDALVEASPYPWLKVVISSRPETWRTIKRGVRLAEHKYYREEETGKLGVEMQPFEVEVKPFGREELPAAYANYQKAFELQTDYEDVPAEVRQMLRDPLTLWLAAEIHRGQEIPRDIKASELYQEYVEALIWTQRLHREDIRFLEQEIVPLMIQKGEYVNSITGETISVAKTTDGRSLFELIHSDEVLSSGRRVNQSYANLADAEILMELDTDVDYEIAFKYERFYEFFGGKRLYELNEGKANLVEAYDRLVTEIRDRPFLWGAVKNALLFELKEGQYDLAVKLSQSEELDVKELMTAVLSESGRENREPTRHILGELLKLGTELKHSIRRRIKTPVSPELELPLRLRMAKRVAIEVAYELEMVNILERAGCDSSPSVRTAAAKQGYKLWTKDREKGFQLITNLGRKVKTKWGVPNTNALEVCAMVSLLMGFEDPSDTETFGHLQQIWRRVIEDMLFYSLDVQAGWKRRAMGWIREQVVRFGVYGLVRLIGYVERDPDIPLTIPEITMFFERTDEEERRLFWELIPYLDPDYGDIEHKHEELLRLASTRDILIAYVLHLVLVVHLLKSKTRMLPIVQEIFEISSTMSPPGPMAQMAVLTFSGRMWKQDDPDDDLLEAYRDILEKFYDRSEESISTLLRRYRRSNMYNYVSLYWRKYGTTRCQFLEDFLDKAVRGENFWAISSHVEKMSLWAAPAYQVSPQGVLDSLVPIVPIREVRQDLINALAVIRAHSPNDVEDFLEDHDFSDWEKRQVRTRDEERMSEVINVITSTFAHTALTYRGTLREQFIWVFKKSAECSNVSKWLGLWFKGAINLIYGSPVFKTDQPPLRR